MTRRAIVAWLRAYAYVALFALYPVFPLLLRGSRPLHTPRLPSTATGLVDLTVVEMAVFAAWFSVGWILMRPSCEQLLAKWQGGPRSIAAGLLEGVGIWIGIALLAGGVAHLVVDRLHVSPSTIEMYRPHAERLVRTEILRNNPAYLLVATTLVSFGLAGLREELWRSAILHGLGALWPRSAQSASATAIIVCATACLFGLGHWPQGRGGMMMTAVLGVAFGLILVGRRSLWEAVLAHGLFDALSFVALALGSAPS